MSKSNTEKNVDFGLPAILFGITLFGLIGHFTTYNFVSKFIGKNSIFIFIINGIIGEALWLGFLYLQNYSKKNPENKKLKSTFTVIKFFYIIIEKLFKIVGYIFDRLALALGLWIFVSAVVNIIFDESYSQPNTSMGIAGVLVIGFFVFRYFTNEDHSSIW